MNRRHSRRNRQYGSISSAVIQTETLETRVLLTATDGTDLNLSAYSPDNAYSSMMSNCSETYSQVSNQYLDTSIYSTAVTSSPINQSISAPSNQFDAYLTSGQTSGDQAYQQAISSQSDASATLQDSVGTGTTTGTDSGTGTGTTNDADPNDAGSLFPAWKPFQFPQGVEFPATSLSVESYQQNLYAVQPSGVDTFTNTVTSIVPVWIIVQCWRRKRFDSQSDKERFVRFCHR